VNTDIEYLKTLEQDLVQAGKRELLLEPARPSKSRRSRVTWGTFAAAIVPVLVVAGLIGWLTTGGIDSSEKAASGGGGTRQIGQASPSATAIDDALEFSGRDPLTSAPAFVAADTLHGGVVVGTGRPVEQTGDVSKIIRDGTMSIRVAKDDFSEGFASVTRIAVNNGGFVISSQTRGQRAGTLTLRIPAARFDEAMLSLREIGTVQAQSITGKDVTAQFIDLQARLRIAKARRTVLLGLQATATTIPEVLTVQRQLDNVQLQIEQIQGNLNFINDQVAEATIRVDLHEQDAAPRTEGTVVENPSLGSAWDRAVQGFLNVISAVVIGLGYLIPLGILVLAGWLVTLAVRRRRAAS
jgi:hypothetical protein